MENMPNDECMELIEKLYEGKMDTNPLIKNLIDRALTTGDCRPLFEHITKHRVFEIQAERNIALKHYLQLNNPFRPYPSREEAKEFLDGPIKLGFINQFDDMFGVDQDIFSLPTIIPGRVGSGKSMLLKYILSQILAMHLKLNMIIPDLKKEYRDLLGITSNIKVLQNNWIKINPLRVPPWMTPEEHIVFFSKIFCRENWVGATSEDTLNDMLEYLYRQRGIFDGNTQNYPTIKDLYNMTSYKLRNQKSFQFRDILLRLQGRLKSYLTCPAYDCHSGISHDFWRTENVILEMDTGFTDHIYSFTVAYIVGLRYTYNKKNGLIGSILRTLFPLDEGRIIFAVRDAETYGESYMTEIITKAREFGLGFIVASPENASFNQTLKAISFLRVCFPLTDGKEKTAIAESFGLDEEQSDFIFKLPRVGQSIVRYGAWEKPFILAVPEYRLEKHFTDAEVEERMAGFYSELDAKIKHAETETAVPLKVTEIIPAAASALLYFLSKEPFSKISEISGAPGFRSPAEVKKALDWLERSEFIKRESYQVSKRGRKSIFAVLTEKAFSYPGVERRHGKGSFEHSLFQNIIKRKLESEGVEARIEGRIKGSSKACDVLASKGDSWISYEVTLNFKNLLSNNIYQDFESGAGEVVIVTRDKKDIDKAVKVIAQAQDQWLNQRLDRISFFTIADFFI